MAGTLIDLVRQVRGGAFAALSVLALAVPASTIPAMARGPDSIADVAE